MQETYISEKKDLIGHFKNREVIYVPGNHEYYRQAIPKLTEKLRTRAKGTNVHILENEALGNLRYSIFRLHIMKAIDFFLFML